MSPSAVSVAAGHGVIGPSARHFAALRIALGLWLAAWFARLLPYAPELYSREGMLPSMDPLFWVLFPTPLRWLDSPAFATAFVGLNALLGLLLALGVARPAVSLALWFGLASCAARNFMSFNLSLNYMGWLLLAMALIPRGEGWSASRRDPEPGWAVPNTLVVGFWAILGLSYSVSGLQKLSLPEWTTGVAVEGLLRSPMGREGWAHALALSLPAPALKAASWGALGVELLALPLIALRATRPYAWAALMLLQVAIGLTTRITELNLSMLIVQGFVLNPRWFIVRINRTS